MKAQHYTMQIPQAVMVNLHKSINETGLEITRLAAIQYYKQRKLSLGKAAELAGMSRIEFIDYLVANGEAVFDYNQTELDEIHTDAKHLNNLLK